MVRDVLKRTYLFPTASFFVFIFAFFLIFVQSNYLRAQNNVNFVEILNLADGQVLSQDYTFKFETNANIEFVELHFIRLDISSLATTRAVAKRESTTSNIWYFDLPIDNLENGNYRLETMAVFYDGSLLAGQTKNFTIAKSLLPIVNLKIVNPEAEQILSGKVTFVAQSDLAITEVIFSIYNSLGILVKQYVSDNLNTTISHQVEVNTNEFGNDGRYQLVVKFINTSNIISEQSRFFYIANAADQNYSTSTVPVRVSIITPITNEKLTGQVLLQAKVSEPVEEVYFYLTGNYIPAREYDNNLWQEYILTSSYPEGEYELLAIAKNKGKEYYSSISKIFFVASAKSEQNIENKDRQTTTTSFSPLKPIVENPINLLNTENNQVSAINTSPDQTTALATSTDELPIECLNQNVKNITCAVYFRNIQNFTESCIEKVLDLNECLEKKEQCLRDGVENYDLCERYLAEPRASRWCDLLEFKNEPLCDSYIDQKKPIITTSSNLDPFCIQQSIFSTNECQKFLTYVKLPAECKRIGITTPEKCRDFLSGQILATACQLAGSNDTVICAQNLISKYQDKTYCLTDDNCKERLNLFINELAAREIALRVLEQAQTKFPNGFISTENSAHSEIQNLLSRLPVNIKDQMAYKLLTAQEAVVVMDDYLVKPLPAIVIKDTDQDGLPDDIEKRLGTNIYLKDTDGDGYDDLTEVKNGYNPLVPNEKWQKSLAAVEKALLAGVVFEHPKIAGQESNDLQIEMITNVTPEQSNDANLLLRGTGPAFSVLSLYIYSDIPLLATVQVDEYGRWQYALADGLVDGEHQVYLVINDETGKIQKKSPAQIFFINEAKAVSAGEYIDLTEITDMTLLEKYYIQGAIGLIILTIIIFFIVRRSQGKSENLV